MRETLPVQPRSEGKKPDLALLVSVFCVVLGTLAFLLLAGVVERGGTTAIDNDILRWVRELALRRDQPDRILGEETVLAITSMGALFILVGFSASVLGLLLLTGRTNASIFLLATLLGALALNYGLKRLYGRARPEIVARLQRVDSHSFPSGHALVSTAVYGALGAIAASLLRERRLKIYVVVIAVIVSLMIGLSRIYLGVHYPSDVLAGWTVGFLWAILCWLGARYLQRRGRIEQPG